MAKKAGWISLFLSIGGGLILSGCTHFAGGAKLEDPSPSSPHAFSGLLPSNSSPPSGLHYVFVIHGMGATRPNYDEPLLRAIEQQGYSKSYEGPYLDVALPHPLQVRGEAFTCTKTPDTAPCTYKTFGQFRIERFDSKHAPAAKVIVFTYFWNDAMAVLQDPFLGKDHDTPTGALINTTLKHDLIDDGFGDATAYLGAAGQLARLGISGALCAMLKDAADPTQTPTSGTSHCQLEQLTADQAFPPRKVDYAFLSFSLGSRMLYDVLSGMKNESNKGSPAPTLALAHFATRTRNFFMAANQMPLLGVGRVTVSKPGESPADPTLLTDTLLPDCPGGFFSFAGCLRTGEGTQLLPFGFNDPQTGGILTEGLQVIALHDPADLLGFRASGGIQDPGNTQFIEISHRNTPVILGLLAWPGSAHATELEHTDSRTLILCGGEAGKDRGLRAKKCL